MAFSQAMGRQEMGRNPNFDFGGKNQKNQESLLRRESEEDALKRALIKAASGMNEKALCSIHFNTFKCIFNVF